jgi:hypothetical protein
MLEMQDAYMDVGGRQCLEQIVEQFPVPVSNAVIPCGEYISKSLSHVIPGAEHNEATRNPDLKMIF